MGRLAKLLSFVRVTRNGAKISDVKIDTGGGNIITAEHFASPGDDAYPLPDDDLITIDTPHNGGKVVVGYVDPLNNQKAQRGDKRIYARDADTGVEVAQVWLKNDGTIISSNDNGSTTINPDGSIKSDNGGGSFELSASGSIKGNNSNGSFELVPGGDFIVNGVTIDVAGNITTPAIITGATVTAVSSLTIASKEMGGHTHAQGNDSNGDSQQNTSGPV